MKDTISLDGTDCHAQDLLNPTGVSVEGKCQNEYSSTFGSLPLSGRLIPEFSGRRNIRDMFSRKASTATYQCATPIPSQKTSRSEESIRGPEGIQTSTTTILPNRVQPDRKRSNRETTHLPSPKRAKPVTQDPKGQKTLKSFFPPRVNANPASSGVFVPKADGLPTENNKDSDSELPQPPETPGLNSKGERGHLNPPVGHANSEIHESVVPANATPPEILSGSVAAATTQIECNVHDPIESKESWSKLFAKPIAPKCEGHNEPCITLLTKKSGFNLGRSFWMCPRPLGPSGAKEKNTQWRCQTFIWCSDWNSRMNDGS